MKKKSWLSIGIALLLGIVLGWVIQPLTMHNRNSINSEPITSTPEPTIKTSTSTPKPVSTPKPTTDPKPDTSTANSESSKSKSTVGGTGWSFDFSTETVTIGEENALKAAKQYLNVMAFSYSGLVEQLEFEGYSHSESIYGADNCGADWKQQAAKAAKQYLNIMAFSKSQLIEQLEFEGFTYEQALYGAEQNGY